MPRWWGPGARWRAAAHARPRHLCSLALALLPPRARLTQGLSLIFWSLTLVVLFK